MRKLMAVSIIVFLCGSVSGAAMTKRDNQEVDFARKVIIGKLARELSETNRAARARCGNACAEDGAIEMAIGLLGIGGDRTSNGLLDLLAVRLDGAAGEELQCQFEKRGKAIAPRVRHFSSSVATSRCEATFNGLRKRELSDIPDVTAKQVCRSPQEVEKERAEVLALLRQGSTCDD